MNPISQFKSLLLEDIAPWFNRNTIDAQFKERLLNNPVVQYTCQPAYSVTYPGPANDFRRFYYRYISNAAISYLNWLHEQMKGALTDDERQFLIRESMERNLVSCLQETAKSFEYRDSSQPDFDYTLNAGRTPAQEQNEMYVLNYLKLQLVRLYMEVQAAFPTFNSREVLKATEVLEYYFQDTKTTEDFLQQAAQLEISPKIKSAPTQRKKEPLLTREYDFRGEMPKGKSYTLIVEHPDKLSKAEEELFNQDILDSELQFINTHGNKRLLGAAYHIMVERGYFKNKIMGINNKRVNTTIRRFLEHRYNVNIEQEVRKLTANNNEDLKEIVDKTFWLTRFLPS